MPYSNIRVCHADSTSGNERWGGGVSMVTAHLNNAVHSYRYCHCSSCSTHICHTKLSECVCVCVCVCVGGGGMRVVQ